MTSAAAAGGSVPRAPASAPAATSATSQASPAVDPGVLLLARAAQRAGAERHVARAEQAAEVGELRVAVGVEAEQPAGEVRRQPGAGADRRSRLIAIASDRLLPVCFLLIGGDSLS